MMNPREQQQIRERKIKKHFEFFYFPNGRTENENEKKRK